MTDRNAFLAKIADHLGKKRDRRVQPDVSTHLAETREQASARADRMRKEARDNATALLGALQEGATAQGWVVHRVPSPEDAADAVIDICQRSAARSVLLARMEALSRVPVEKTLKAAGIDVTVAARPEGEAYSEEARLAVRRAAFTADVGITGVDYAVAETGTVVLHPRGGVSRLVSLAPPRHIAIIEKGQVLPSLDELFALEREAFHAGRLTSSYNLISGPSRTGDIGATIVQGVHGPVEVHMVLIG